MKKTLFLIFIVILLTGCNEVRIENNRRIEVSGKIVDEAGRAVPGINVFTVATRNTERTFNTDKILGAGISDNNGDFTFTSLDSFTHDFSIAVNPSEFEGTASRPSIYYVDLTGDHELSYDLGVINLVQQVNFEFQIENTSNTQDTLIYTIRFQQANASFQFENGEFSPLTGLEDNVISLREHTPDEEAEVHTFTTLVGSEIRFNYALGENAVQEILIPVTLQNTSYEFEY